MASFIPVFLLMRSSTAMNNIDLKLLRCSFSHHHCCCCMLVHAPNHPLLVLPSTVRVAITTSPCTVSKSFFQIDESRAILPCASSPFSTIFHRTYIPSAVPLPFVNPCYSSPKSHSTVLLIIVSKSLSNSFSRPTCQSCVMPPVVSWVMYTPFTLPCVHYQAHPLLHVLFPPLPPLAALFPFSSSL